MRPNSVPGLFRRLVVLRWQRLSRRSRLALTVGAAIVSVGALLSASTCAFGSCPLRSGGCPYSGQTLAAPATDGLPTNSESTGCPHARRSQSD